MKECVQAKIVCQKRRDATALVRNLLIRVYQLSNTASFYSFRLTRLRGRGCMSDQNSTATWCMETPEGFEANRHLIGLILKFSMPISVIWTYRGVEKARYREGDLTWRSRGKPTLDQVI